MMTRRTAMKLLAGGAAALACNRRALALADPGEETAYSDPEAADRWVKEWIRKETVKPATATNALMKAPDGTLIVGRFADRMYYTNNVIGWNPSTLAQQKSYSPVRVPKGFVTDFASIPRVLWPLLPSDGPYVYAAVVHDYLYWEQHLPREAADDILKFLMQDFEVDAATVWAVYGGVRVGGWSAWNENAKLKAAGEKRVLKKLPRDPTARWTAVKQQAEYFE